MPKPYPKEFRDDVVAVARKGEAPLNQIAKDFGISEGCLHNWLKKADVDDGVRAGVTDGERAELREPRSATGSSSKKTKCCAGRPPTCRRRTCRENSLPARP